ncbi:MAG: MarR family transcriptional regulator [Planctomycetaceae bacterium]|jgi:MarR family transcriptional regulator for hemolysin
MKQGDTVAVDIEHDFEASVGYWVTVSALAFRKALNEELAPHGVTYRQSQVLGWLILDGELSQSELATRMDIEPPTLTGIIDRMECAGHVARHVSDSDRRRKMIRIEEAARPVWKKIAECARRLRKVATAGLTDRQVTELLELLRIVHQNLSKRTSDVSHNH